MAKILQADGSIAEMTDAEAGTVISPEDERAHLCALLDEHVRGLIEVGSSFSVTGVAQPIPLTGRIEDQTIYLGLLTRAQAYKSAGVTTPVLSVRDRDDVIQRLTSDQMIELISAAIAWVEDVKQTSWDMKDSTGAFPGGIPADFDNPSHWP